MRRIGDHVVVLGASLAGLLAARVLADAYGRVTVVERDPVPDTAENRKGVPQGRHAHLLLPRGAQILDGVEETLGADLVSTPPDAAAARRPGWRRSATTSPRKNNSRSR